MEKGKGSEKEKEVNMANIPDSPDFELVNAPDQLIRAKKPVCSHWDICAGDYASGCGENDVCLIDHT